MSAGLVSQRNISNSVVSQSAHGRQSSRFLTTTKRASGDEKTGVFAVVTSLSPDTTRLVPERSPLSWEVSVARGNTKEETIVVQQGVRLGDRVVRLGRRLQEAENVIRKGFGDPMVGMSVGNGFYCLSSGAVHTGRYRLCRQRQEHPCAELEPASGCGRTSNTVRISNR